ncbi:hypothetical protein [Arenimonas composti]|uniref:Uncharacterized protein n=1 Tax=Arenimonas composti TR7-09 = DSM 18010 TaxID=1121013 RepID=A0A091C202_9GAMM|nr:hypothetical protein [Arenimonas composti]KFN50670.1 hypothetical protein P873_05780 [Arenimonas composti TR7-09 = DSM 18010]
MTFDDPCAHDDPVPPLAASVGSGRVQAGLSRMDAPLLAPWTFCLPTPSPVWREDPAWFEFLRAGLRERRGD